MKKIRFVVTLVFLFVTLSLNLFASTAADIQSQITQLQQQKAQLLSQKQAIVSQLSALGVEVPQDLDEASATASATLDKDKKKEDEEDYKGKKPDINEVDLSRPEGPRETPELTDLASRIEIGPDGKPRVPVEDVIRFQSNTQMMRDLKNASPELREAFNRTLRESVYGPHDQKLIEYIRSLEPDPEKRKKMEIKIDDFRTPKEGQTLEDMMRDINTDRDYRVLVKNEKGEWIEVETSKWKDKSQMILSETSGFQPPKSWDDMTPAERTAARDKHQERFQKPEGWDTMTPEEQFNAIKKHQDDFVPPKGWDQMTGAERMRAIEEHNAELSQMQTDKDHAEASRDYSDQDIDPQTGRPRQKEEPNILAVKRGEATLIDPEGLGAQYREKVDAALRDGNKSEAIAQLQKGVDSLGHIREGYQKQGYDVGTLPKDLQSAMEVIANAKTDSRANPAEVEAKLKELGFDGGIDEVSQKISEQVKSLKDAEITTGAQVRAAVNKGAEEVKRHAEAHDEAKKVTEVAVKLADGAYTAHTWNSEAEARAAANQQVARRNQAVDSFYTRYDSDPEFRKAI
ncbi:MAG: hypothetical protein JW938_02970, partial [Candidatus Omnitrophica bacterium]|nr:hypothetical protein [Candidatus Omnitrophota bacterium]